MLRRLPAALLGDVPQIQAIEIEAVKLDAIQTKAKRDFEFCGSESGLQMRLNLVLRAYLSLQLVMLIEEEIRII